MRNTDAMLAFYRGLGFIMTKSNAAVSVHISDTQMIDFHRPTLWQNTTFTLKAPAARPPCGDRCFVWEGTAAVRTGEERGGSGSHNHRFVNHPGFMPFILAARGRTQPTASRVARDGSALTKP